VKILPRYPVGNTFGLESLAQWGCEIRCPNDLQTALDFADKNNLQIKVLGAGSNVILSPQLSGLVGIMRIEGIKILDESSESVIVEVGAGVCWHNFVIETLERGWFGLENLVLIPGSVGAAPVQNIGAYGVDISEFIVAVNVLDSAGAKRQITNKDAQFSYRSSVFKKQPNWIIVSVVIRLTKKANPEVAYPELNQAVKALDLVQPSAQNIAQCVMQLRNSKLPDPKQYSNAGSFFKNPVVDRSVGDAMSAHGFKTFAYGQGYKLAAAQLIDRAGWKGIRRGGVGCWPNQPLVIVNYGSATCSDILSFAKDVAHDISEKFDVQLEIEPSLLS
jgi:UDP-N-acetylmuramate dehydrogenase